MTKSLAMLFILLALGSAWAADPVVDSVVFEQSTDGSGLITITYDILDEDGDELLVSIEASEDGGLNWDFPCDSLAGDLGEGIASGAGKQIQWFFAAEHPNLFLDNLVLRVTAEDEWSPSIPPGFVSIPAGSFQMGAAEGELGAWPAEGPRHEVTLTRPIHVKITEVTNQEFMEMAQWAMDNGYAYATTYTIFDDMDDAPNWNLIDLWDSHYCEIAYADDILTNTNPDHPVKMVTWYGAAAFCDWMSLREGLPRAYDHETWECNGGSPYMASGYRLPTEAEWEYACRAGSETAFAGGDITQLACDPLDAVLDSLAWYCGNHDNWTHPVAQKTANAWGLYDMHGNIFEWCNDWHADSYYSASPGTDPAGPTTGQARVLRGGDWAYGPGGCRSAFRSNSYPDNRYYYTGFRPVKTAE